MGSTGILFPGQGAQTVGMGAEVCQASRAAAKVFDLADGILDFDVRQLCFEGPEEELRRTDISQPAILTASLALLEALKEYGKLEVASGQAAGGLSLGEYTALAAAGALSYEDAIHIVQLRGRFMQEACDLEPGGMASVIGLDPAIIEGICAEVAKIGKICLANYNSPVQVAIAGAQKPLEKASQRAREEGAKVFPLKVAGAFHSELMSPAARKLEPHLSEVAIRPPGIPVVVNVTGALTNNPEEIRRCLIQQVDHPVRWVQCMETLLGAGLTDFFEIGPGKVLAGLMRKIERSARVTSISSPEDIEKL